MPRFDGTGPRGLGPMTGRGLGPCGLGLGRGGGYGRGFWCGCPMCGYYPGKKLTQDEEKDLLKEEMEELNREKEAIEKRLGELGAK